jgi:hypothetical protein
MSLDARIAGHLGVDAGALAAWRAEGQDDETVGYVRLARRFAIPRLARGRWQLRYDGADGLGCYDLPRKGLRAIHSIAREQDGDVWAHVSVSRRDRCLPTWEQTRDIWRLIYPAVAGVIVIPAETSHVNMAEVMHIWGNLSRPAVPDFTRGHGTI